MDEKDYFLYSLIFCYVFYYSNYFTNVGGNFLNYYLNELLNFFINFKELDNMIDTIEEIYQEKSMEKPNVRYEDKFLTEIRKLNKEFIFDEKEKELFEEKRSHFLHNTQNEYRMEVKKNELFYRYYIKCIISNLPDDYVKLSYIF